MKKIIIAAAIAALSGCATGPYVPKVRGNVIPQPDNRYTVESRGADVQKSTAYALESAEAVCLKQNKRHVITSKKASYAGEHGTEYNRDQINAFNAAFLMAKKQGHMYKAVNKPDDYLAVVEFTCES